MFSIWTLALITGLYVTVLFGVATWGNKIGKPPRQVYALALGIHCTSWAFFGTTTQSLQFGWAFIPTYVGVIIVMLFGFSALKKIAHICRRYKISSLAEFIGIRYHHSNVLAGIVVVLCFVGVIPYIALQLDAISSAIALMTGDNAQWSGSLSFYVTVFMAGFAIWFGTRTLNLTTKRHGLMLTIAFESVLKLFGLLIVGIYCVYILSDGWVDLFTRSLENETTKHILTQSSSIWIYASHVILGICSMFCLPRQFHINFVENNNDAELYLSRWVFPAYLVLMSVFILPIALTGQLLTDSALSSNGIAGNSDLFVLSIPLSQGNYGVTISAYIGGLAASTSMIIVATLALGNMVANNLLTPIWLYSRKVPSRQERLSVNQILRIRQATIIVLLFIAFWYHQYISQASPLVKSGTIAIALMAQIAPAMLIGIYWRGVNRLGALLSIIVGSVLVSYLMIYPAVLSSYYSGPAPSDSDFAFAIFLSLLVNISVLLMVSVFSSSKDSKTNPFTDDMPARMPLNISVQKLLSLVERVVPADSYSAFVKIHSLERYDDSYNAPDFLIFTAEQTLAEHLGNASTRILLNAISDDEGEQSQELSDLVAMASQSFQFNHEVLHSSIAHLPQGISVVDSELKLVAWNKQYEQLFEYPKGFLQERLDVADILKFNAQRGLIKHDKDISAPAQGNQVDARQFVSKESKEADDAITRRLQLMRQRKAYKYVRQHSEDKIIEISGSPLPGGGYITSYTDVSEYIKIQKQLEEAKGALEQRVLQRTQELQIAKTEAESANLSKTRFLAATGHDLMQPFNAATLLASMLDEKLSKTEHQEISRQLVQSLDNADELLSMLIEITKLDTGKIIPRPSVFPLSELLESLIQEFSVIAQQKEIQLSYVYTSVWLHTDKRLLKRIIQNLLANAIRYTDSGAVLLGVRRKADQKCELWVMDTGRGIAKDNQSKIFTEFHRIAQYENVDQEEGQDAQGLGLGLTIVERTSQLLNIDLSLRSELNKGTCFALLLNIYKTQKYKKQAPEQLKQDEKHFLTDKRILVLENDRNVASALEAILQDWGATVALAQDLSTAFAAGDEFDLIIADYHLDNGENGVDVCASLIQKTGRDTPMILSSADRSEHIQEQGIAQNMRYLPKPIKRAALKRLIQTRLEV